MGQSPFSEPHSSAACQGIPRTIRERMLVYIDRTQVYYIAGYMTHTHTHTNTHTHLILIQFNSQSRYLPTALNSIHTIDIFC